MAFFHKEDFPVALSDEVLGVLNEMEEKLRLICKSPVQVFFDSSNFIGRNPGDPLDVRVFVEDEDFDDVLDFSDAYVSGPVSLDVSQSIYKNSFESGIWRSLV